MRHRRSYVVFAVAFVVHLLATMLSAHAAEPAPWIAPAIDGATFTPTVADDGAITWRARWVLARETVDLLRDRDVVLRLATPLPRGETLAPSRGVEAVLEDERITAVRVSAGALEIRESGMGRDVRATFVQRGSRGVLGAPFVLGDAVQILDVAPANGARLEIDPRGPFVRHVGYFAPDSLTHAARQQARSVTWFGGDVMESALYARGDDVRAAGRIAGEAFTRQQIAARTVLPIAGIFVAIVAALFVAMRRLRHAAGAERADALLALEIERADAR
jgi:hypothetical protein